MTQFLTSFRPLLKCHLISGPPLTRLSWNRKLPLPHSSFVLSTALTMPSDLLWDVKMYLSFYRTTVSLSPTRMAAPRGRKFCLFSSLLNLRCPEQHLEYSRSSINVYWMNEYRHMSSYCHRCCLFYLTQCTKRQVCVLHAGCQPRWVSLGPYVKKMPRLCMPDPEAGSGKPAYNFPHNTSQCLPGYSLQRSAEHLKGKNALSSLTLNGCTGKK